MANRLWWLLEPHDFRNGLSEAKQSPAPFELLRKLSKFDLGLSEILSLDRQIQRSIAADGASSGLPMLKLAILGSSTLEHLLPGLRVSALRHGFIFDIHVSDYGQYLREVLDPSSRLHQFHPDIVLLALDATHLAGFELSADPQAATSATIERLTGIWKAIRDKFGAQVIHQAVLPTPMPLMGGNEHRLPGSPAQMVTDLNAQLRVAAALNEVDVLAIDAQAAFDGLSAWHDPALWLRAKQEISPSASHHYGDLVARLVGARRGLSGKCLVLDLDNTLWGGVIGDDGLAGIALGQGSAVGEAFVNFQKYISNLSARGVILAVCSKNDESNALEPFEKHPDMVLKRDQIACFVANWEDKATNLRRIAESLNIGVDALVFADDNPFERNIVRRELPMVRVPELPEDPTLYAQCLAQSGFFEAVAVTSEDRSRTQLYQARQASEASRATATDLDGYLESLNMIMDWRRFDVVGQARITQLVNKTNQFNLTTRRYTDAEIGAILTDPNKIGLQIRLRDDFGDHGVIAILIGELRPNAEVTVETWLMSCRVLGRGVEQACFQVLAEEAVAAGAKTMVGRYIPTAKNGLVKDHFSKLDFVLTHEACDGTTTWRFDLNRFELQPVFMQITKG